MSHTEGRLVVDDDNSIIDEEGYLVADVIGVWKSDEEIKANARRLVACWNAFEGCATGRIEEEGDVLCMVTSVAVKNRQLTQERDEALDVLRELAHGKYTNELGNRAVALLAKHKEPS
jgi:hypothetical protein